MAAVARWGAAEVMDGLVRAMQLDEALGGGGGGRVRWVPWHVPHVTAEQLRGRRWHRACGR